MVVALHLGMGNRTYVWGGGRVLVENTKEASGVNMVEHPPHYTSGKIEVWDFIADQRFDYFLGNVVKYVSRAGRKDDYIQDLLKARAYLDKAIDLEHERRTQCSE